MPLNAFSQHFRRRENLCNCCSLEMEFVSDEDDGSSNEGSELNELEEDNPEEAAVLSISDDEIASSEEEIPVSESAMSASVTNDNSADSRSGSGEENENQSGDNMSTIPTCETTSNPVVQGAEASSERIGTSEDCNKSNEDDNQHLLSPIHEQSSNMISSDIRENNQSFVDSLRIFEYSIDPERGIDIFVEKIVDDDCRPRANEETAASDVSSNSLDIGVENSSCVSETNTNPSPLQNVLEGKYSEIGVVQNSSGTSDHSSNGSPLKIEDSFKSKNLSNNESSPDTKTDSTTANRNSANNSNQGYQVLTGNSKSTSPLQSSIKYEKFTDSVKSIINNFFKSNNRLPSEQPSLIQPNRQECPTWTAEAAEEELARVFLDVIFTIQNAVQFSPTNLKSAGKRKRLAQARGTPPPKTKEAWNSSGSDSSSSTSTSSEHSSPDTDDDALQKSPETISVPEPNSIEVKSNQVDTEEESSEVELNCNSPTISKASKALVRVTAGKRARSDSTDSSDSDITGNDSYPEDENSAFSPVIAALELLAREHRSMMLHMSKLILREFEGEGPVQIEKVRDYEMCFAVMQSEYAKFSNKLDSLITDNNMPTSRINRLCRWRDDNALYIARVKYGIIFFNNYRGFQSKPGNVEILSSLNQFENNIRGIKEWMKK